MRKKNYSSIIVPLFVVLLVFVWYEIFNGGTAALPRLYFLDVGQGDSELAILPGGVKILTDAGPDRRVIQDLQRLLPPDDRYIDLAIISHPQLDHFNGFNFILDQYRMGAFITNGRFDSKNVREWPALIDKIKSRKIPIITLGAGDRVKYNDSEIDFLSPGPKFSQSAELNDTGLVELVKTGGLRVLLTADIGFNIENYLISHNASFTVDVLKIPHHGSKYSSGSDFLRVLDPRIAVIEVGAQNKYGHPAHEALERLASTSAITFRTDKNGTVEIDDESQKLQVFTQK